MAKKLSNNDSDSRDDDIPLAAMCNDESDAGPAEPPPEPPGRGGPRPGQGPRPLNTNQRPIFKFRR